MGFSQPYGVRMGTPWDFHRNLVGSVNPMGFTWEAENPHGISVDTPWGSVNLQSTLWGSHGNHANPIGAYGIPMGIITLTELFRRSYGNANYRPQ